MASVAAGCSGGSGGGVGMRSIESDVVFGAAAEVANTDVGGLSESEATAFDELPEQFFDPPATRTTRLPQREAPPECPPAALEEFPDAPATLWGPEDRKAPPREGLYRWQRDGIVTSDETAGRPINVRGFERRLIRNVDLISDEETAEGGNEVVFTYEVVQPSISGTNIVLTTYQVKSVGSPPTRSVFNPTQGQDEFTAGEPERGLVIKRIEVQDSDGAQVSVFEPATGLLLLPLRVRPGEQWQSVAFDARTGQRMELAGQTLAKERVDACGDIIEGWEVTSTLTSTTDDGVTSNTYEYIVAPQYGAILVSEHLRPTAAVGENDLRFTIAQQDPDPLPAGAEEES
jgi:hypothetical protein